MHTTRELALRALYEIWQKDGKPKDVLEYLSESLEKRDRAFLMELVYGVVRFRDTLDWVLQEFLKKPSGIGRLP
jgi:16S rRNA (cytosine967-C5)-methyltransferase